MQQAARNKEIKAAERRISKIFKGTPAKESAWPGYKDNLE
jgi:hypothetical protein